MLRLTIIVMGLIFAVGQANANVLGTWMTKGERSHVRIEKCGEKLCGSIIWLKDPNRKDGKPKIDARNKDENKRGRRILGLPLMTAFEATDDPKFWVNGEIYNPENGKTYNCEMTLQEDGILKVHGYVGVPLFGESQYWKKVEE